MKSLLEAIFSLIFFAIIIMNLPYIIGFISLCIIIKCVYSFVSDASSDNEKTQSSYQAKVEERNNTNSEYQQKREEQKTKTNSTSNYSGYRYSRSRYRNDDEYDNSYYDDWQDDIPSEEGDGFRGTGAPFL